MAERRPPQVVIDPGRVDDLERQCREIIGHAMAVPAASLSIDARAHRVTAPELLALIDGWRATRPMAEAAQQMDLLGEATRG